MKSLWYPLVATIALSSNAWCEESEKGDLSRQPNRGRLGPIVLARDLLDRILREVAWEVVTKHPHLGVAK